MNIKLMVVLLCCHCLGTKLCSILFHPIDCSLPGSSIREISPARMLEWIAISFRGSSWPRGQTCIYCISSRFLTTEPLGKPNLLIKNGAGNKWLYSTKMYASKLVCPRTYLAVQWLRLHAPCTRALSSIPGQGTRSHMPQIRVYML